MTADSTASSTLASTQGAAATRDAPAFDFYPERWLVGTAAMSDLEQIAYLRLLCHQWLGGDAGLTADAATLRRLAGKGCTAAVLAKFAKGGDGRLRNARLETIRLEQRDRIRKKSEQRRAAAQKRWHGPGAEPGSRAVSGAAAATAEARAAYGHPPGLSRAHAHACAHEPDGCVPEAEGEHHETSRQQSAEAMRPHEPRTAGEAAEAVRPFCGADAHLPPLTTHPGYDRASLARERAGGWPGLEEVKAYAETLLTPGECAERFWNDCESSGWVNRHGLPICDWRPLFRNFATVWKAQEARQKAARKPAAGAGFAGGQAFRPRYVAYSAKTATAGLTAEEIGTFCPDQR